MMRSRGSWLAAAAVLTALSGCAAALLGSASSRPPPAHNGRTAAQVSEDRAITAAVKGRLAADPMVKGLLVSIDTRDGVVVLRGEVHRSEQRAAAERAARAVKGVRAVRNELWVRGS